MKLYTLSILILISLFTFGQEKYIVVNNDSISLREFKKDYKTNIETEGWDNAVDAYINFTLIQQEAQKTKLDTTKSFQVVFKQSLDPIKQKYLIDYQIEDDLKKDLWKQLQSDRKVEVYAIGIQNKFDKEQVAERVKLVEDLRHAVCNNSTPSKKAAEYLDQTQTRQLWMRPFTIPSEIEQVAYNTPVGACSKIINSENGNFFVKVLDERPSTGIVYLLYIYNKSKDDIDKAAQWLKNDSAWVDVKMKFHQQEGENGFHEQAVFEANIPKALYQKVSEMSDKYSEPFALNDGFYILNVRNQKKLDTYENWEEWITAKIKESDYALNYVKNTEARANKVVKITENQDALDEVVDVLGKDFFKKEGEINFDGDKAIWSIGNNQFTQQQFLKEMELSRNYFNDKTDVESFLAVVIPKFKTQFKLNNYTQDMELYEPKLKKDAMILKNAILVDYYLDHEIFQKAKSDTVGLKSYLANHTQDYRFPKRYDMEMYRFTKDEDGKQILRMLKKGISKEEILQEFQDKRKQNGALEIVAKHGKFKADRSYFGKNFNPKKKLQISSFNDEKVVIKMNEILPARTKTYKEAGYLLKEDYSTYMYHQTLDKLREDATIIIPDTL